MSTLTVQDLALIVQTIQVCSTRNVFKLAEYTHIKNVYDYFESLHTTAQPVATSEHAHAITDVCKIIEVISERGGFVLQEFQTIHGLHQRLHAASLTVSAESLTTPAQSTTP